MDYDKESGAIFGIIWQLAKLWQAENLDENGNPKPVHISNAAFNPIMQDEGKGFDSDYFQVRLTYLRTMPVFEEAERFLASGHENKAQELLKFHYPDFRSMHPVMWKELFRRLRGENVSEAKTKEERIRRILRKRDISFRELIKSHFDDVLLELDGENIPVFTNRKKKPYAKKWTDLKGPKRTKAVNNLRRYFHPLKRSGRKPAPLDSQSVPKPITIAQSH
jgi:hypothetical protein